MEKLGVWIGVVQSTRKDTYSDSVGYRYNEKCRRYKIS